MAGLEITLSDYFLHCPALLADTESQLDNLCFVSIGPDRYLLCWRFPGSIQPPAYFKMAFAVDCKISSRQCYLTTQGDNSMFEGYPDIHSTVASCWLEPMEDQCGLRAWQCLLHCLHEVSLSLGEGTCTSELISRPIAIGADETELIQVSSRLYDDNGHSLANEFPIFNSCGDQRPPETFDDIPIGLPVKVCFTLLHGPGIHGNRLIRGHFLSIREARYSRLRTLLQNAVS
ncbi:hypothetical protein SERLA73DRAFT_174445 [Serpula lacrymans var. lacrymans S7.3]|uniref:Uncharacterized protein n=2 Tax=Serpula lacrymans var. lacrymans TaxID=341189 RepID=F8PFZ8_SERL3|nr:uncharacterized protein SERLADRAFT_455959 [Serpula lacrymans var. lacrymans S7.9]EGO05333.1 hypothetical protein SERLA73DRAFT_174445 [Serpula lacrymans var. lacrymans S7.3]EGO31185.1 hypothetical protein SERLADRAFT_455959 [Serpula lacrymans var. lacrymans S7.9]